MIIVCSVGKCVLILGKGYLVVLFRGKGEWGREVFVLYLIVVVLLWYGVNWVQDWGDFIWVVNYYDRKIQVMGKFSNGEY